jgi:plastocyanin
MEENMTKSWQRTLLAAVLATAWLSVACRSQSVMQTRGPENPRVIEVLATEFDFEPKEILVEPGERVTVQLRNEGRAVHSLVFALPDAQPRLARAVPPQQIGQLTFTAPTRSGTYTFYCPIGNHRELGMVGTLVVVSR